MWTGIRAGPLSVVSRPRTLNKAKGALLTPMWPTEQLFCKLKHSVVFKRLPQLPELSHLVQKFSNAFVSKEMHAHSDPLL